MEDGVNIFFIQRLLGHSTLVTTMRYLRIAHTDPHENQKINLLNVRYFHVVFTLPQELNPIIYQKQKSLYNLMF